MLKIDLRPGEALSIGDAIITLESKSGQVARLAVKADKSIPVQRVRQSTSMARLVAEQGITRKT